jgi:pilus assembly protein CpaC
MTMRIKNQSPRYAVRSPALQKSSLKSSLFGRAVRKYALKGILLRGILLGAVSGLISIAPLLAGNSFAAGIVKPADSEITIDISKGSLIKLDQPAANVFISNPAVADIQVKSPTLVYVFGKQAGETTLYAVSEGDKVIYSSTIKVTHSIEHLKAALSSIVEDASRLNIQEVDGTLILTGSVKTADDAESVRALAQKLAGPDHEVINRLQVQSPVQVNLRVRIAEVSRDVSKQLGFNWEGGIFGSKGSFGLQNAAPAIAGAVPGPSGIIPGPKLFAMPGQSAGQNIGSFFGNFTSGKIDINGVIDALETEGFLTVLAEPNLTALSGKKASFLAGGEFPIPVPQGGQSNSITIMYKQFGVSLAFTPTVMSDNKINLKVEPEVSQLSSTGSVTLSGFNVPALTTRRAETTVELGSGQSFAIAGLLQNNIQNTLNKFPGLGDLPILGALFRSTKFQRQETELLIIVTPYIVRPVSGTKIALPTDGYVAPNDSERILHGAAYHAHGSETPPAPQDKNGTASAQPSGFILN